MLLRKKTLIIICLMLVGMILLIYLASQAILVKSYTDLEDRDVRAGLTGALYAINYDLSTIDSVTVDYAYWNDTYSYAQGKGPDGYIQSNFVDTTMLNQRLNVVAIVNASDQIVYARGYDLEETADAPVPEGIISELSAGSPLLRSAATDRLHGIIVLPDGPMLISAYPIRQSDGGGAPAGTLIMGRFLSDDEVNALRNMSGLSIAVFPYSETGMPDDFKPAEGLADGNDRVIVMPVDANTVNGYTVIDDIDGKPAVVLRIDVPRLAYQQSQATLSYTIAALLISGVVFSIVMMFFLERMIVAPMIRLNEDVGKVGPDPGTATRVSVIGNDEVAQLARTINHTLDALEASQRQLRDSEQRMRSMVENVNEVVWEADADLKIIYASPKARNVFRCEPEELLGRSPFDLVKPGEEEQIRAVIHDMIVRKGSFTQVEFSIVRQDGTPAYIEVGGNPVLDTGGKITGYRGIARDVTGRRQAEETIRRSERRLADIINHLPDATFAIDREGRIIAWNKAIEEMTGSKAADMLGKGDHEYSIPFYGDRRPILIDLIFESDDEIGHRRYINVKKEGRTLMGETPLPRPLGKSAILWGKATALYDERGELAGAIESIRDITELRHSEAVLRENEARLNTIIHSSPLPLFVIDQNHRIIYWSKSLEVYSGVPAGDVIGTNRQWKATYAEERPCIADLLLDGNIDGIARWYPDGYQKSATIEGAYEATGHIPRSDKWLHGIAVVIRDENGNAIGAIEIFEDVTERMRAEDQIRASLAEKEVLLKEIHHRVKNNLQIISSLLSLQSEKLSSDDFAQTFHESQDRIRTMALIHEKLYQSKDLSRIDFEEYVRSLTTYLRHSYAAGRDIAIAIDIDSISLGIDTAIPCGLIINELVSNSLKYAFRDGRPGQIHVGLVKTGDRYVLTVSDDGAGLPPGLDFRNTQSLGLQLVNTLVGQLEGATELDTSRGTAFRITFAEINPRFMQPVAP